MEMSVPLDNGFLRRECPNCEREFKWFADPDSNPEDKVAPELYYCPYCGEPSSPDSWWTKPQVEHAQAIAMNDALSQVGDAFKSLERKSRGRTLQWKVARGGDEVNPTVLIEPNDMLIVESPCHPQEPIKVSEDWTDSLHCLICGVEFSVG